RSATAVNEPNKTLAGGGSCSSVSSAVRRSGSSSAAALFLYPKSLLQIRRNCKSLGGAAHFGEGFSLSTMESSSKNDRVTWEGCSVLLDINDGDRIVFARLSPAATLKLGREHCLLKPLIGAPFGSVFQVENGKDGPYLSCMLQTSEVRLPGKDGQEKENDTEEVEMRDNRGLVDDNTAQSLTGEDINAMKREGATGGQIVEALIANSSTFEKKTAFSQEKYLLRKQKKYAPRILLRRPFARSICEGYFKKHPARTGFLRLDTLSLLLSLANVTANSDILVVDMVGGLITGAVAERLGGSGYICNTYLGAIGYPMGIVRIFNFSDETCKRIVRCSFGDLCPAQNGTSEQVVEAENLTKASQDTKEQLSSGDPTNNDVSTKEDIPSAETSEIVADIDGSPVQKSNKAVEPGKNASQEQIKLWRERGFPSLLVAAPELDPWTTVQKLLPLLSSSAPFAIYHPYLQPLATCMHNLKIERMAFGLQITEPWLREYQVLPSRTHPCMQMNAFGGYILSGTKISGAESNAQM
ncbi:hypothetical protein V2J09_011626, partial [Rumex salicifolius]